MAVAVAAVDGIVVDVVVGAVGAVVGVGMIVRTGGAVIVHVGVLVGVGMGVRMGVDEIAVAMLVAVHVGMRMGVAMLVRVGLARLRRLVVHRVLPQRSSWPSRLGPKIRLITSSPASTVILT